MPKHPNSKGKGPGRGIGTFLDLDPAVRVREAGSFRDEVLTNGPPTAKGVEKWIGSAIDRQRLLAKAVFGAIRWPKTLGRPLTPNLVDGFEFLHQRENVNGVVGANGPIKANKLETMPAPFVYDASTADDYRVAFQFFADFFNHFSYRMREVPWERPAGLRPAYRFLNPYQIIPFTNDGETVVFPDIEVVYVPLIRLGGIRVLK